MVTDINIDRKDDPRLEFGVANIMCAFILGWVKDQQYLKLWLIVIGIALLLWAFKDILSLSQNILFCMTVPLIIQGMKLIYHYDDVPITPTGI